MELFSNVGQVQKSMDYSLNNLQNDDKLHTRKLEENQDVQKDNENDEEKKNKIREELQKTVEELNKEMSPLNTDIKFKFDDKVDELVVNVIDKNTDKVIRKIPSDEALKLMEKMRELVGALFDKKG
ncbi:MAG: flagellar biosynthesis protein FlaG [Epsilonproteobacteria bacterium]|jgi:flagellar protein FlaG|nr:flagellar biosynthesis protein FlaG [Campylobacterota bacterium]